MKLFPRLWQLLLHLTLLTLSAAHATAAEPPAAASPAADYQPHMGQPGKDVVWIPTPDHVAISMLDLAHVGAGDYVIDLGSGDGRLVIEAARRGAQGRGVEFNADLVALSRRNAVAAGVAERATFVQRDMFEADISRATVLPLFLVPANLTRLAPKFLQLAPGARIVSNTYEIGGGWAPDETLRANPCLSWCVAHLYIVPARVAGQWQVDDGATLFLDQRYQQVYGSYQIDNAAVAIGNGRLHGYDIHFTVNRADYDGHIDGDTMSGTVHGLSSHSFTAAHLTQEPVSE